MVKVNCHPRRRTREHTSDGAQTSEIFLTKTCMIHNFCALSTEDMASTEKPEKSQPSCWGANYCRLVRTPSFFQSETKEIYVLKTGSMAVFLLLLSTGLLLIKSQGTIQANQYGPPTSIATDNCCHARISFVFGKKPSKNQRYL